MELRYETTFSTPWVLRFQLPGGQISSPLVVVTFQPPSGQMLTPFGKFSDPTMVKLKPL